MFFDKDSLCYFSCNYYLCIEKYVYMDFYINIFNFVFYDYVFIYVFMYINVVNDIIGIW